MYQYFLQVVAFLNANSGAIQGVSDFVIACFAILSFVISMKALREASNTRKDERIPILRVGITGPMNAITNGGIDHYVSVQIKNVGYGIARNIKVMVANKDPQFVRSLDTEMEWSVKVPLSSGDSERINALSEEKKTILVEYEDIFSRKVSSKAYFEDTRQETFPVFKVTRWDPILPQ